MPVRQIKVRFVILVLCFGLRRKRQPFCIKEDQGLTISDAENVFFAPKLYLCTASGQKNV